MARLAGRLTWRVKLRTRTYQTDVAGSPVQRRGRRRILKAARRERQSWAGWRRLTSWRQAPRATSCATPPSLADRRAETPPGHCPVRRRTSSGRPWSTDAVKGSRFTSPSGFPDRGIGRDLLGGSGTQGRTETSSQGLAHPRRQAQEHCAGRIVVSGSLRLCQSQASTNLAATADDPEETGENEREGQTDFQRQLAVDARLGPGLGPEIGARRHKSTRGGLVQGESGSMGASPRRAPREELDQRKDRLDLGGHGEAVDARAGAPAMKRLLLLVRGAGIPGPLPLGG